MRLMAGKPVFLSFWKVFRWIVLVVAIFVIFQILGHPPRPTLSMTPQEAKQQAQSFDQKLNELARRERKEAHFTSDEVSAAYSQQLTGSASGTAEPVAGQQKPPELTPNSQVAENTPVRQVDVDFHGNELTGQFATNVYGKDVYITISGRLASKDGYATFDPTAFKFGNLSIPVSLVNDTLQKKLAEPENREKLKLPDFVQSIRIENGELVVEEKN